MMSTVMGDYKSEKRGHIIALNALQLRSKRFINYVNAHSNKQFITLYRLNNSQLIAMLNHFVGMKDTEVIISMIKDNKSDEEILDYIKENLKFKNTEEIKDFRNSKIASNTYRYILKGKNYPNILDIGVGNGKKIKSILSYLNSDYKYNLYGTDIENWGPYKQNRTFDFPIKFIQIKPYKIPYDDKMFDCIFIILTLHHAENIIEVLKECYRILKDDGCIVIVEHDVWTDETHMLVDLQHRIYSNIFNEDSNAVKACYYNFYEWDMIFNKVGFKLIYGSHIQDDVAYNLRYDMLQIKFYCKKDYKYSSCFYK